MNGRANSPVAAQEPQNKLRALCKRRHRSVTIYQRLALVRILLGSLDSGMCSGAACLSAITRTPVEVIIPAKFDQTVCLCVRVRLVCVYVFSSCVCTCSVHVCVRVQFMCVSVFYERQTAAEDRRCSRSVSQLSAVHGSPVTLSWPVPDTAPRRGRTVSSFTPSPAG